MRVVGTLELSRLPSYGVSSSWVALAGTTLNGATVLVSVAGTFVGVSGRTTCEERLHRAASFEASMPLAAVKSTMPSTLVRTTQRSFSAEGRTSLTDLV